jgi:hypothetical protein
MYAQQQWENVWPTSCGQTCTCDQTEIIVTRIHPVWQTCYEVCDSGIDGWCDCWWEP